MNGELAINWRKSPFRRHLTPFLRQTAPSQTQVAAKTGSAPLPAFL